MSDQSFRVYLVGLKLHRAEATGEGFRSAETRHPIKAALLRDC